MNNIMAFILDTNKFNLDSNKYLSDQANEI